MTEILPKNSYKVLVLGASGLLGQVVIEKLCSEKIKVVGLYHHNLPLFKNDYVNYIQGDILDIAFLMEILKECTHVVNCAAVVSFSRYQQKAMYQTNVIGTRNIVDCCLYYTSIKLIHISSVAALGRNNNSIIDENSKWSDSVPHTYYAYTKHLAELEVFRGLEEGLNAVMLNPSIILAPTLDNRSSSKLINYVRKKAIFYPKGFLNIVDARDVCLAVFKSLSAPTNGERILLNSNRLSYKEFFEKLAIQMNVAPPKIPTNQFISSLVWLIDSLVCFFTHKEPLITKETIQLSKKDYVYQSIKQDLLNIKYRPIDDTIAWCATS